MWLQLQEVAEAIGESDSSVGLIITLTIAVVTAVMVLLDRFVFLLTKWGVIRKNGNERMRSSLTLDQIKSGVTGPSPDDPPNGPSTSDYHELLERVVSSNERQSASTELLITTLKEMQSSGRLRDIEMSRQLDMLAHMMVS